MPDTPLTAADMVKINDISIREYGASDLFLDTPFLNMLPITDASHGDVHKYLVEDGAPTVGFRAVNVGRAHSKSSDRVVTASLAILDASFHCDKAQADVYKKGGPEAFVQREAIRHIKAALVKFEQQVLRGVADGDAAGFTGFNDALVPGAGNILVTGGASGVSLTSCYGVRVGEGDVQLVIGNGLKFDVGDTVVQAIVDGSGNKLPAYYTPISAYVGIEIGSKNSIGRIHNLQGSAGATANILTDVLMSRLLESYPSSRVPTHFVTNRKNIGALQRSRTTYSPTGSPAPRPTEYEGIPIVATDSSKIGEFSI